MRWGTVMDWVQALDTENVAAIRPENEKRAELIRGRSVTAHLEGPKIEPNRSDGTRPHLTLDQLAQSWPAVMLLAEVYLLKFAPKGWANPL